MSEETTKRVNCHENGNLPLFCIEKDTRVGVLYAPFACVPVSMTNKKERLFTAKAGQVSMGAIQQSDKSEIISIWTYRLLTIKLPYSIISINYYIGVFAWK